MGLSLQFSKGCGIVLPTKPINSDDEDAARNRLEMARRLSLESVFAGGL